MVFSSASSNRRRENCNRDGDGNHGYYRIGWSLDGSGDVVGGWTAPAEIPGWFGDENQGGGIAVVQWPWSWAWP